jgi:hypothetical protein
MVATTPLTARDYHSKFENKGKHSLIQLKESDDITANHGYSEQNVTIINANSCIKRG